MRKTIIGAALAVTALVAASATGAATRAKAFTFCTDPTFPPMELASPSGAITGFDVDMASALAKTWGATSAPKERRFYDADHAMAVPEAVTDRDAWLLKELGLGGPGLPPLPSPSPR